MSRYNGWFGRKGLDNAPPSVLGAAKKLLGQINFRRTAPGVKTLVERQTLDDGWSIEARFDGDVPTVYVIPPDDGIQPCRLYVESGLLDLGPNIAADAGERFNRGEPAFGEGRATLYFGDGVECAPPEPGLNGVVQVTGGGLASQCLPKAGASVPSRLKDPVKKKAQAMLPASLWSGLMQRYVQAVYGGDVLKYSGTATALTIETATINVASSVGLVDIDGTLLFVVIDDGTVDFRAVVPKSPCIDAVLRMWSTMPATTDLQKARKNKVLTIALSGCVIGKVVATTSMSATGNRHFASRSAWVFAHDAPTAVAVLEEGGTATAYEATFSITDGSAGVALTTLATGEVLNHGQWPLVVADQSPYAAPVAHASGFAESDDPLQAGQTYEFPVYATYEAGAPVIVYCTAISSSLSIADMSECFDMENPYGPVIIGDDDARRCRTDFTETAQVAYGFHAAGWSTVGTNDCFLNDDGDVVRTLAAGYQGVSIGTEMQHDSYVAAGDLSNRVPGQALSGPHTGSCAIYNDTFGSASTVTIDRTENEDCVVTYSWAPTDDVGMSQLTRPYFAASGVVFGGYANGAGLQVLSLAWGATTCVVADHYTFNGGRGAYLSFVGAAYWLFIGGDRVHDYAEFSATQERTTNTYNTPGDCGSGTTATAVDDVLVTVTKTLPAAEGDLVIGMWGFASPQLDDDRLFVTYNTPSDTPAEGSAIAYPDPRCRGLESLACSVFMTGASSEHSEQHEVDVAVPDSEFEHPDGVGTFTADDDTRGDCDAFEYLGLQELSDVHIEADLAAGEGKPFVLEDQAAPVWLVEGFAYQAARSLLGACIAPVAQRNRGASLNMDRQTINGGYSTVSTPSFVGWA